MENALEKYCMEMMNTYGGAYTIHSELGVVAVYKMGIQELDVLSFEAALEELKEIELEEQY